ncbi:MAG: TrkH family potassium uptake protein [Methanoregula sp.]|jgi:trk system potassium uptake protein TrkH|nr:TrkH family potassium uptake protein [Methanoregula sp.]
MYELVSPIELGRIGKYFGYFLMALGIILLPPAAFAGLLHETHAAVIFTIVAGIMLCAGFILYRLLPATELLSKEAIVLTAVFFPLSSAISAVLVQLITGVTYTDALFECIAGITTTGLSVMPTISDPVFLFFRSWLQWIGGLGIIIVVLLIFIKPGTSAFLLYETQDSTDLVKPGVIATAMMFGRVYIAITLLAFGLFWAGGMIPFDALCHALSAVSTGGFSTKTGSIADFSGVLIPVMMCVVMVMGGTDFSIFPGLFRDPKKFFSDVQLRYFTLIAITGIALMTFSLSGTESVIDAIPIAVFQVISALTSSGFSTINIGGLPETSRAVLLVLMGIGGSLGSTSGGLKIFRFILIVQLIRVIVMRIFLPREVVIPLKVGERVMEQDEVYQHVSYVFLYGIVLAVSCFIFLVYGFGMSNSLFEVTSALGGVGLSAGLTSPTLPLILKGVLAVDMLLGRLEIIPFLILLNPTTWWKRQPENLKPH